MFVVVVVVVVFFFCGFCWRKPDSARSRWIYSKLRTDMKIREYNINTTAVLIGDDHSKACRDPVCLSVCLSALQRFFFHFLFISVHSSVSSFSYVYWVRMNISEFDKQMYILTLMSAHECSLSCKRRCRRNEITFSKQYNHALSQAKKRYNSLYLQILYTNTMTVSIVRLYKL